MVAPCRGRASEVRSAARLGVRGCKALGLGRGLGLLGGSLQQTATLSCQQKPPVSQATSRQQVPRMADRILSCDADPC